MNFNQKLHHIINKNNSLLCVGLDIDKEKMPSFLFTKKKNPFLDFNKAIIDATKDLVCAYKLNMAFYETLGKQCFTLLEKTIQYIPDDIVVILDGKRNDIGNSARKYAQACFDVYRADAVTLNPYLGEDTVKPFLEYEDKCSFILCRTSNPSAPDFQDQICVTRNVPLYQMVAEKIKAWNVQGTCGAVVGATYPQELKVIREILGETIPLLIPGIGKQGGDIQQAVTFGTNKEGTLAIINSSRGILFAGGGRDFATQSRRKSLLLRDEINKYR